VRVLQEAVQRAEAHLRDVRARFEAGLIPPSDVALVEAQRSRQQMQLIEAEHLKRSLSEDVRRLAGIEGEVEIVPVAELRTRPDSADPARSLSQPLLSPPVATAADSDMVAAALRGRAERQALLERVSAAEDRQAAAFSSRKPTIGLAGTVDYANPNPRIFPRLDAWQQSWDVNVVVNWSLWDAGRSKAEATQAAAAALAARERLADLDGLITSDVRQRQLDIASATAAIAAAEDGVRSSQEARRVVGERFRVGVATSTDVLDAQVALLQAELDRTRALANLKLAEARLDRAMGR
jgi:outer membrane protein TolC